ncbi:unnamed protein product [Paramecium sonneborni]|uniref:Uncharacterized protein n=1 Tax=Paramecium sonneborni TaxID=65129 RepID=A0A8S1L1E4_9CILI|nr:unnamed protein product [Paramecium sonneborni]
MSNKNPIMQDNAQTNNSLIKENDSKVVNNKSQVQQLTEEQKQQQMDQFKKFLQQTGISDAFQVIFAEIIDKKLKEEDSYKYTADRLREIGKGLSTEQMKAKSEMQKKELAEKMKKK